MRTRDLDLNRQRQDMIQKAATLCFVQRGFHATSMKDVCAAAGLSPGTVYHYVRSKTDIIRGIIEDERAITTELMRPLTDAEDFFPALFTALDAIASEITQDDLSLSAEIAAETLRQPDLLELSREATSEATDRLARAILRAQERGQIDPALDPRQAAAMVIAFIDGILWKATLFGIDQMVVQLPFMKQAIARMLGKSEGAV